MGTLIQTQQPQSRQCRDDVSRKRFSAWGKSRLEMLTNLSFFTATLLLLSHTASSLERVPQGVYYPTSFSNQPPHQGDYTANRFHLAQQKRELPHSSWTKRELVDQNNNPPLWSPRQAARPLGRPPFFLPTLKLTSQPLESPLTPLFGREPFQLPPPPPPAPSLRRALRWPPWPPDPHSAQMVSLATHGRWSPGHLATHGRWWESPGEELEQILAAGTFERMELEQLQEYPRDSQRAAVDQSPEQVGTPPPQNQPTSQETRTQGGETGSPLHAALLGGRPAPPRSMPRPLLRLEGGLAGESSNKGA